MLGTPATPGISPRIVDEIFSELDSMAVKNGVTYSIEISFMEIYNERVKDLFSDDPLSPSSAGSGSLMRKKSKKSIKVFEDANNEYRDLKVRNSPSVGVYVEGLKRLGKEQGIRNAEDVKKVMRSGMEHRATAETNMNATSSRSHAIFQICVRSKNEVKGIQRYANINLVDLAGSERINLSGAEGTRLVEATRINLSLSTLRRVIDILIENYQRKKNDPKLVPPYRDSTLTWILSESLGGNSVTMMIATVSPFEGNREDTVNTLRYAFKAKSIINTVRVNEERSNVVVSAMTREIELLRMKLEEAAADPEAAENINNEINALEGMTKSNAEKTLEEQNAIREQLEMLQRAHEEAEAVKRELNDLQSQNVEEGLENAKVEKELVEKTLASKMAEAEKQRAVVRKYEEALEKERKVRQELEDKKEVVRKREELFRQEVMLVKRKQFALAFQKAFVRAGQTSGVARLESEVREINDRILRTALDDERAASGARSTAISNTHMQYCLARIEGEIQKTEERNNQALDKIQQQVAGMSEEKKQAEEDARVEKERQRQIRAQMTAFKDAQAKKNVNTQRQHAQLRARKDVLQDGLEKKMDLIKQLKEQREILEKEVVSLRERTAEERSLKVDNITRMKEVRRKCEEEKVRESGYMEEERRVKDEIAINREDIRMAMVRCEDLRDVVSEVTRNHGDLKRFVTFRFFSAGEFDGTPPDTLQVEPFDGDRIWTNSGYAYRRSNSPSTPLRSNSPMTPIRGGSPSPPRSASRSPSAIINRRITSITRSGTPQSHKRSMSPLFSRTAAPLPS
eukprot:TRINITY_DN6709_c0_g2_i1.p1 TRINITY_DN6709_c0_g2~~TRINITY_DN6709_c0_g2_i1.p1  ORF type:complete len:925 (+),score=355.16 TRINITY_DN6709_c0_g2_i1:378-2777(+)